MGTSTDAILFYGYCWTEETSRPWKIGSNDDDDDDDWETRYAATQGCLPPTAKFPARQVTPTAANNWSATPKDYTPSEQAIIDEHRAYWSRKQEIAKATPCEVGTHCSGECPMPYVAVSASRTLARRGYPEEISSLAVDPTWGAQLADFCRRLGIKIDGKRVGWWLVSNWN
jgi:hypothetical protein